MPTTMLRRSVVTLYIGDIETLRRRLTFDGALERLERIETAEVEIA